MAGMRCFPGRKGGGCLRREPPQPIPPVPTTPIQSPGKTKGVCQGAEFESQLPGQSWMTPLGSVPLGGQEGLGGLGWVLERNPAGCAGVRPCGSGVGSSRQAVELTHGVWYTVCCHLGND